ncbi:MAG: YHS domain-containing protein [Rhodobacteraceae bacterium]|jgi:YHS domain-containing protein|nr:YHS domain-containing protein [Paracoccaceae bacterium]
MLRRSAFALAFTVIAATAGAAIAGDQYIDDTGFAVSGYDVVSYFDLPQSAIGEPQQGPLAGKSSITAEYNGATFAFASEENRDRFLADPARFAPQYDGHCAYGVAKGGKVPGNPTLWRIVDGKLYLNITQNVVGFWEADIPGNLRASETNWVTLEPQAASDMDIPQFASAAPVTN